MAFSFNDATRKEWSRQLKLVKNKIAFKKTWGGGILSYFFQPQMSRAFMGPSVSNDATNRSSTDRPTKWIYCAVLLPYLVIEGCVKRSLKISTAQQDVDNFCCCCWFQALFSFLFLKIVRGGCLSLMQLFWSLRTIITKASPLLKADLNATMKMEPKVKRKMFQLCDEKRALDTHLFPLRPRHP